MANWTAESWDRSKSAEEMLANGPPLKRRKLRLFSVALCNRFRKYVADHDCLAALAAAERDAETAMPKEELRAIRIKAEVAAGRFTMRPSSQQEITVAAARAFPYAIHSKPRAATLAVARLIHSAACWQRVGPAPSDRSWGAAHRIEERLQADLLRHIVGNPFRPFPAPPPLPAAVVQLAAALEAGEEAAFALRDAFLDAGQTELADHFSRDEPHPRGCWALDLIGGRSGARP